MRPNQPLNKRRLALKALGGSALAGGLADKLPGAWQRPLVQSAILPAHAQTSGGLGLTIYHETGAPLASTRLTYTMEGGGNNPITAVTFRSTAQTAYTPAESLLPAAYAQANQLVLLEDTTLDFRNGIARGNLPLNYNNQIPCSVPITLQLAPNRLSIERMQTGATNCTGRALRVRLVSDQTVINTNALQPGETPPPIQTPRPITPQIPSAQTTALPSTQHWWEFGEYQASSGDRDLILIRGTFTTTAAVGTGVSQADVREHTFTVYVNREPFYTWDVSGAQITLADGTSYPVDTTHSTYVAEFRWVIGEPTFDTAYQPTVGTLAPVNFFPGIAVDAAIIGIAFFYNGSTWTVQRPGGDTILEHGVSAVAGIPAVSAQPPAPLVPLTTPAPGTTGTGPITIAMEQPSPQPVVEEGDTITIRITRTAGPYDVLFQLSQTQATTGLTRNRGTASITYEPIPAGATVSENFGRYDLVGIRIPSTSTHIDITVRAHTDTDAETDETIEFAIFSSDVQSVNPGTSTQAGPAIQVGNNSFTFTITDPAPTIPAGERWFTWETTGTGFDGTTIYTATGEFRFVTANLATAGTVTQDDPYYHMVTVTDGSQTRVADLIPANGTVDGVAGTSKNYTFSMALTAPFAFGSSSDFWIVVATQNFVGADFGTGSFIYLNHGVATAIDASVPTITEKLTP